MIIIAALLSLIALIAWCGVGLIYAGVSASDSGLRSLRLWQLIISGPATWALYIEERRRP